jgi:hypothetical protein
MNTLHEPLLIACAPPDLLIGLGLFFALAALTLFILAMDAGHYPTSRKSLARYLSADYWIRRQRRSVFCYARQLDRISAQEGFGKLTSPDSRNLWSKFTPLPYSIQRTPLP